MYKFAGMWLEFQPMKKPKDAVKDVEGKRADYMVSYHEG